MTKLSTLAGTVAAAVLAVSLSGALSISEAEAAACKTSRSCGVSARAVSLTGGKGVSFHTTHAAVRKAKSARKAGATKHRVAKAHHVSHRAGKRQRVAHTGNAVPAGRGSVVAMIKSSAPRYGVPTWFALRIAQVESGYNPRARGAAGELGVYQLKCATARGLGFRGACSGLLNASTNIQFGLKHLSLAVRSSRGNLKLAASKHNGGLGRQRLVPRYVAMVF